MPSKIILLTLVLIFSTLSSQGASLPPIQGTCIDDETGEPISGVLAASIRIRDSTDERGMYDSGPFPCKEGHFSYTPIKPGLHSLTLVSPGYAPVKVDVRVPEFKDTLTVRFPKAKASIRARFLLDGKPANLDWLNQEIQTRISSGVVDCRAIDKQLRIFCLEEKNFNELAKSRAPGKTDELILTGFNPGKLRLLGITWENPPKNYLTSEEKTVVIEPGQEIPVDFHVWKNAFYLVEMLPEDGRIIDAFTVSVDAYPDVFSESLCSDKAGNTFNLTIPEGSQTVRLQAPGYRPLEFDPSQLPSRGLGGIWGQYSRERFISLPLQLDPQQKSSLVKEDGKTQSDKLAPFLHLQHPDRIEHFPELIQCEGNVCVYQIKPVLESILTVGKCKSDIVSDPQRIISRELQKDIEWTFDRDSQRLTVTDAQTPDNHDIVVVARRVFPWQWKIPGSIQKDSVTVSFGEETGKRGIDYEVDEARGIITLLRQSCCCKKGQFFINYYYNNQQSPQSPFGTIRQWDLTVMTENEWKEYIQQFPDIIQKNIIIHVDAEATFDPLIYTIPYVVIPHSLSVAVVSRDTSKPVRNLEYKKDFQYDPDKSILKLDGSSTLDRNREYLDIRALPSYDAFVFHRLQPGDPIAISLDGKRLQRDKDYFVDYAAGKIQLAQPISTKPGARFRIEAGGQTLTVSR